MLTFILRVLYLPLPHSLSTKDDAMCLAALSINDIESTNPFIYTSEPLV